MHENRRDENSIARDIVDASFKIHSTLGPGLLESVYETILAHELVTRGLAVKRRRYPCYLRGANV